MFFFPLSVACSTEVISINLCKKAPEIDVKIEGEEIDIY